MRSFLALVVASTLLMGLSPNAGTQDDQDSKPPLSKTDRAAAKKIQKRMQGAWKLTGMQIVSEESRVTSGLDLQQIGYALVHEGYLSLEFHMRLVDKEDKDFGQSLVSGLHRFELDGTGALETTSIVATQTRRDGSIEFEAPGSKRSYRVDFEGENLTLTRDDGHRLEFQRMGDAQRRHFDIFGRPTPYDDADGVSTDKDKEDVGGERK